MNELLYDCADSIFKKYNQSLRSIFHSISHVTTPSKPRNTSLVWRSSASFATNDGRLISENGIIQFCKEMHLCPDVVSRKTLTEILLGFQDCDVNQISGIKANMYKSPKLEMDFDMFWAFLCRVASAGFSTLCDSPNLEAKLELLFLQIDKYRPLTELRKPGARQEAASGLVPSTQAGQGDEPNDAPSFEVLVLAGTIPDLNFELRRLFEMYCGYGRRAEAGSSGVNCRLDCGQLQRLLADTGALGGAGALVMSSEIDILFQSLVQGSVKQLSYAQFLQLLWRIGKKKYGPESTWFAKDDVNPASLDPELPALPFHALLMDCILPSASQIACAYALKGNGEWQRRWEVLEDAQTKLWELKGHLVSPLLDSVSAQSPKERSGPEVQITPKRIGSDSKANLTSGNNDLEASNQKGALLHTDTDLHPSPGLKRTGVDWIEGDKHSADKSKDLTPKRASSHDRPTQIPTLLSPSESAEHSLVEGEKTLPTSPVHLQPTIGHQPVIQEQKQDGVKAQASERMVSSENPKEKWPGHNLLSSLFVPDDSPLDLTTYSEQDSTSSPFAGMKNFKQTDGTSLSFTSGNNSSDKEEATLRNIYHEEEKNYLSETVQDVSHCSPKLLEMCSPLKSDAKSDGSFSPMQLDIDEAKSPTWLLDKPIVSRLDTHSRDQYQSGNNGLDHSGHSMYVSPSEASSDECNPAKCGFTDSFQEIMQRERFANSSPFSDSVDPSRGVYSPTGNLFNASELLQKEPIAAIQPVSNPQQFLNNANDFFENDSSLTPSLNTESLMDLSQQSSVQLSTNHMKDSPTSENGIPQSITGGGRNYVCLSAEDLTDAALDEMLKVGTPSGTPQLTPSSSPKRSPTQTSRKSGNSSPKAQEKGILKDPASPKSTIRKSVSFTKDQPEGNILDSNNVNFPEIGNGNDESNNTVHTEVVNPKGPLAENIPPEPPPLDLASLAALPIESPKSPSEIPNKLGLSDLSCEPIQPPMKLDSCPLANSIPKHQCTRMCETFADVSNLSLLSPRDSSGGSPDQPRAESFSNAEQYGTPVQDECSAETSLPGTKVSERDLPNLSRSDNGRDNLKHEPPAKPSAKSSFSPFKPIQDLPWETINSVPPVSEFSQPRVHADLNQKTSPLVFTKKTLPLVEKLIDPDQGVDDDFTEPHERHTSSVRYDETDNQLPGSLQSQSLRPFEKSDAWQAADLFMGAGGNANIDFEHASGPILPSYLTSGGLYPSQSSNSQLSDFFEKADGIQRTPASPVQVKPSPVKYLSPSREDITIATNLEPESIPTCSAARIGFQPDILPITDDETENMKFPKSPTLEGSTDFLTNAELPSYLKQEDQNDDIPSFLQSGRSNRKWKNNTELFVNNETPKHGKYQGASSKNDQNRYHTSINGSHSYNPQNYSPDHSGRGYRRQNDDSEDDIDWSSFGNKYRENPQQSGFSGRLTPQMARKIYSDYGKGKKIKSRSHPRDGPVQDRLTPQPPRPRTGSRQNLLQSLPMEMSRGQKLSKIKAQFGSSSKPDPRFRDRVYDYWLAQENELQRNVARKHYT